MEPPKTRWRAAAILRKWTLCLMIGVCTGRTRWQNVSTPRRCRQSTTLRKRSTTSRHRPSRCGRASKRKAVSFAASTKPTRASCASATTSKPSALRLRRGSSWCARRLTRCSNRPNSPATSRCRWPLSRTRPPNRSTRSSQNWGRSLPRCRYPSPLKRYDDAAGGHWTKRLIGVVWGESTREGTPMPKLIKVLLQIEEVALGHVINTLDRTPGVAKFDLLFDQKPVTNGHDKFANAPNGGEKKPRKLPVRKEITGEKFIIKSLAKQKGPVKTSFVRDAFQKDGRQPD